MPNAIVPMPPRRRKLIALGLLLPGLLAYVLGAIVLADFLPPHWLVDLVYFIVAGIGWAFPAMALLSWAEGPRKSKVSNPPETGP